MTQTPTERLVIVEATNWKEAVITLLEPESPYTPWRCDADEVEEGDAVAFVLHTEPTSVLTELGSVGADGDPCRAGVSLGSVRSMGLVELETLVMMTGFRWNGDPRRHWVLDGEMAIRMSLALVDCKNRGDQYTRFGRNPLAAARILLHSQGDCTGCEQRMDLGFHGACNYIHVHTVDAYRRDQSTAEAMADWPGALCHRCFARMQKGGYTSLVDFRVAQHPSCPSCGAQRTREALFGMQMTTDIPPWLDPRGCCVTIDDWMCGQCGHTW